MDIILILVCVAGGAIGALTLEHGWGWVLAKIKSAKP